MNKLTGMDVTMTATLKLKNLLGAAVIGALAMSGPVPPAFGQPTSSIDSPIFRSPKRPTKETAQTLRDELSEGWVSARGRFV